MNAVGRRPDVSCKMNAISLALPEGSDVGFIFLQELWQGSGWQLTVKAKYILLEITTESW